jgi:signal peptidase II
LEVLLKNHLHAYGFLIGIASIIVVFDQLTKELVRRNLVFQESWVPWEWLAPYARIVHWRNTGAAFGMFQDGNLVFTILAFVVSGLILYYFPRLPREELVLRLALALQLGGAVGNLIDRLTLGYVVDFVSVGTFPVFNVADASISTGAVVLVLSVWLKERQGAKHVTEQANPEPPRSIRLEEVQDE